jgi:hypothetical protein
MVEVESFSIIYLLYGLLCSPHDIISMRRQRRKGASSTILRISLIYQNGVIKIREYFIDNQSGEGGVVGKESSFAQATEDEARGKEKGGFAICDLRLSNGGIRCPPSPPDGGYGGRSKG